MSVQQSYPLRCLFCGDSGHTLLHCKNVLPNIVALTQERDALEARIAELQARNTKLVQILAGIHELLHPPLIEHDGKTYKFVNPDANAVLEELSSRIRAIPDSIDALPNEQGGHIARLEKDAARYRWLTEDHSDPQTMEKCRELLYRMPVMSYASASYDIDAAIADSKEAS